MERPVARKRWPASQTRRSVAMTRGLNRRSNTTLTHSFKGAATPVIASHPPEGDQLDVSLEQADETSTFTFSRVP